ncbi:unnamed protein product [Camellia sinensis]
MFISIWLLFFKARNFRFHCGLVYVSEPGYMLFRAGVPRHAIIKKFGGKEISQLEDLISVLSNFVEVLAAQQSPENPNWFQVVYNLNSKPSSLILCSSFSFLWNPDQ